MPAAQLSCRVVAPQLAAAAALGMLQATESCYTELPKRYQRSSHLGWHVADGRHPVASKCLHFPDLYCPDQCIVLTDDRAVTPLRLTNTSTVLSCAFILTVQSLLYD